MWHIVGMGYVFVTLMFSLAQPNLPRMLIYLFFLTVLPTAFAFWVAMVRIRNKRMKAARRPADKSLPE